MASAVPRFGGFSRGFGGEFGSGSRRSKSVYGANGIDGPGVNVDS